MTLRQGQRDFPVCLHTADVYRQFFVMTGGIPSVTPFFKELIDGIMGDRSRTERLDLMAVEQPLMTPYWSDKRAKVEAIQAAVYAVAGYGGFGATSDAILGIPEGRKWLRYASNYHLADYYSEKSLSQELKFFDRFLKGVDNNWERDTPKTTVEILEPGVGTGVADTCSGETWPLESTEYRKLYLNAVDASLDTEPPTEAALASYDAMTGKQTFTHTFVKDTAIAGFMKGKFWVQTNGANDMDVFVRVEKLKGDAVIPLTINNARQRVSLRELDTSLSTDYRPVHTFRECQLLEANEVVPVEIWLQSHAMMFRRGEQLRIIVGGNALATTSFGTASGLRTTGKHMIHCGAQRHSFIQIPIVPLSKS